MKLNELDIKVFLEKTAGSDPVPGGGSVSALAGSLAAALGEMVTGLTIGRKKYADAEEQMKKLAPLFKSAREFLVASIDKDAEAYDMVFQAFKLPKETDEQKQVRGKAIQEATVIAARVPLEVAKVSVSMMPLIEEVARKGNQNAITDACVAMMCARTAALGALLNVRINLSGLKDELLVAELTKECDSLQKEAEEREHKLLHSINI